MLFQLLENTSDQGNEKAVKTGLFSLDHKGFTARIQVSS
jgi:hypothetical protein